ncbi:hypothetical protein [Tateyamaria omphalii]|uniref:Flagellar FliJ protein n=1 Tax=Tateyamaria omphalii TaxID=299262 RepID=A0A1P8MYX4_9RHOB|nr:hypothetical protein [Tateyamaria omphalii]APX13287.1 hypothetical protein BWR18_17570 [Tateyamaria omphalii]
MKELDMLKQLADLKHRHSELALTKLRNRESALRAELKRLQSLAHDTHCLPASDANLRAIGGDIIWLKWLAKNQRSLSIELAQVLAQKESLMAAFRMATGKKAVTEELMAQEALKMKADDRKKRLEQAIDLAQLQQQPRNQ